jgi:hypothetical protein
VVCRLQPSELRIIDIRRCHELHRDSENVGSFAKIFGASRSKSNSPKLVEMIVVAFDLVGGVVNIVASEAAPIVAMIG